VPNRVDGEDGGAAPRADGPRAGGGPGGGRSEEGPAGGQGGAPGGGRGEEGPQGGGRRALLGDPRLGRLLEGILAVASELDLASLLHRVVESAAVLVDARYGALGVLGDAGELAEFVTVGLSPEEEAAIGERPRGRGILGLLLREGRPLRLPDLRQHPAAWGVPPHHPAMRSFLGVPVRVRGALFGSLYLTEKRGGAEFDEEDEELVAALAAVAGVAVDNARLHERLLSLTLVEDRERVARDLHDTVVQRLFAAAMALQGAIRLAGDDEVRRRIESVVEEIDATITEIREAVFELHAHRPGLRDAVLDVARAASEALGFRPVVRLEGPVDTAVPPEVADHLVATLREALSNVAQHAQATAVEVRLTVGPEIVLSVWDNGVGLGGAPQGRGRGLANMAERARGLGGTLEVGPAPAVGTLLVWRVPLARTAA
jgi:signal transduction histidine kinase